MKVTKETPKRLHEQGIRTIVVHDRFVENGMPRLHGPARTTVWLVRGSEDELRAFAKARAAGEQVPSDPGVELLGFASATCAERDVFNRRLGMRIALGRALEQLPKDELAAAGIGGAR